MTDDVAAVVLAGGDSTRFGPPSEDKALATYRGGALLERAVYAVEPVSAEPVYVAVDSLERKRSFEDEVEGNQRWILDVEDAGGPIAGLVSACRTTDRAWVFALACDVPLASTETASTVVERRSPGADAVVPYVGGRPQVLHALYRRETVLQAWRRRGADSPSRLLRSFDTVLGIQADELPEAVDPDAIAYDVDRATDLNRLKSSRRPV